MQNFLTESLKQMDGSSANLGVMDKPSLEQFGLDKRQLEQLRLDSKQIHSHMAAAKNHIGEHK